MTRAVVVGIVAVAAVVGAGLYFGCRRPEPPGLDGPVRVLPDSVVVKTRPVPVTKWRDRIVIQRVPVQVVVTESVPDTAWAMRYARAAIKADSVRRARAAGDTLAREPRPVLPTVAGRYDGKRFRLWLTRSDGSLLMATQRVRPRWQFFSGFDGGTDTLPIFEQDRVWIWALRQAGKCALPSAAMAGVGALVNQQDRALGALVAGSASLVGCVVGGR